MKVAALITFICIIGVAVALLNPCASPKDTCASDSNCGGPYSSVACFKETSSAANPTCNLATSARVKCNDTCTHRYQCSAGFDCADSRCQYRSEGFMAPAYQADAGCPCGGGLLNCASGVCDSATGLCVRAKYRWGAKCTKGSDCVTGVCNNNVCVGKSEGATCTPASSSAAECGKGLRCVQGICTAASAVDGDCNVMSMENTCVAGATCVQTSSTNYRCKKYHSLPVGATCHSHELCEYGLMCNSTSNRCESFTPYLTTAPDYGLDNLYYECGSKTMPMTDVVCSATTDSVPACNMTESIADYTSTATTFFDCLIEHDIMWEDSLSWLMSTNPLDPDANGINNCLPELAQMMCKGYLQKFTTEYEYWLPLFDCSTRTPRHFNTTATHLCGKKTLPYLACPADYSPPKPNSAFTAHASIIVVLSLLFAAIWVL